MFISQCNDFFHNIHRVIIHVRMIFISLVYGSIKRRKSSKRLSVHSVYPAALGHVTGSGDRRSDTGADYVEMDLVDSGQVLGYLFIKMNAAFFKNGACSRGLCICVYAARNISIV